MATQRRSETDSVFTHLSCRSCDRQYDGTLTEFPCPECGGILDPRYEYDSIGISRSDWEQRDSSLWDYRELLPVTDQDAVVSMGEGKTPLIDCPSLADSLGVSRLAIKDEGQNPTNSFKDRGQAVAISRAAQQDIQTVGLSSAGNAGHAASAYAARAGMDCHVFLPQQAGEVKKQMIRAHGARLHLIDGKIDDAGEAFARARNKHGWYSVKTFETPYRHEGKKTMGYEIFEAFDWESPDHIVYPTGGGVGLIGIWKAYQELRELGWVTDDPPSLHVAQTTGAAPLVEAIHGDDTEHTPWESPDSEARGVEIPDPGASPWILEAVAESGGTGVAVTDEKTAAAALSMAQEGGPEMCLTAGVAFAGAKRLAEHGEFGSGESVVVTNTGAGCKTAEKLDAAARKQP